MAEFDLDVIPPDVLALCRRLAETGHQAHLVGGGIRDALLGRTPSDFDLATDAHPEVVMRLFGQRFVIPTGLQHGTVTVLTGDPPHQRHVEVTTFRGEGEYLDGRRPSSVTFSSTLQEDLARRDFTMNAIAFDPLTRVLSDPFEGRSDLHARLIRAVRDPLERFREDGLRAMRAVRQATQLGFEIEPLTQAAIPETLASFRKVSAERIRDELMKLLVAPEPSRGIELMRTTGLLGEVLPELLEGVNHPQNRRYRGDVYQHTLAALDQIAAVPVLRLAALLHGVAKPRSAVPIANAPGEFTFDGHERLGAQLVDAICRRLRLSTDDRELVVALVSQHAFVYAPDWTEGEVRRFLRKVGLNRLEALFALREAEVAGRGSGQQQDADTKELRARIEATLAASDVLGPGDLAINGADVMRVLGIRPGRRVGVILAALLERVLDDPALNSRETLERLLPEVAGAGDVQP